MSRSTTRDLVLDGEALAHRTEALLAAHVPLSLLLDLADPTGPRSRDLFAAEGACLDWVVPRQRRLVADQVVPGQVVPGQVAPGQVAPGQVAPGGPVHALTA